MATKEPLSCFCEDNGSFGHSNIREAAIVGFEPTWHYFFESDRNAPFFMALDSWKKIKRLEQDIKDIFSSHGQNPITMDFVDAYIECFSGEFQQNYLKDKPFSRGHLGRGYQHIYKTENRAIHAKTPP